MKSKIYPSILVTKTEFLSAQIAFHEGGLPYTPPSSETYFVKFEPIMRASVKPLANQITEEWAEGETESKDGYWY